jgi:hypothetical protein
VSPGTPALAAKLGIHEGMTVVIVNAPEGFKLELPEGVDLRRQARGKADVVIAFFVKRIELEKRVATLGKAVYPAGAFWVAWPKRASGVETDLTDHVVREVALPDGLVDNKVCAVDETWTGLRLVWRLQHRH